MSKRMAGYAIRGVAWPLPLMLALSVVLGGCSLGRGAAPAQLFDLGPSTATSGTWPSPATSGTSAASPASAMSGASAASEASTRHAGAARREPVAVSFSAAQMLTDTGVIWRVGDSASPHSYATYRWAAPPSQLVQQRVIDRLSAAGPVVQDGVDPRAPLLQVTLTRFEQVYAEDGASSSGQVALQAVLVRDRRVVDAVRLARGAPAPTQDAQGGVLALRAATDAAASDLAAWLERSLLAASSTSAESPLSASTDPMAAAAARRAPGAAGSASARFADAPSSGLTSRSLP
ncbi:ABC-type transport auxiliary lipoprotein component domain-containing protein [Bordetella sputigena]|uniref:ABC-type transport auxiliary lipoprotein family protein n=1 Tax=Bordetella sputigena TaxID=1416810 RepID=UPI0039EE1A1D